MHVMIDDELYSAFLGYLHNKGQLFSEILTMLHFLFGITFLLSLSFIDTTSDFSILHLIL